MNFYSTDQLEHELAEHWNKLRKISKYSEIDIHKVVALITSKIRFINVQLIPKKLFIKAEGLTSAIDIDDTEFVALTEHIRGKLRISERLKKTKMA